MSPQKTHFNATFIPDSNGTDRDAREKNRAFKVTGPFVAMIRYMIVRDLRQFSLIYLIFAYAFAQSIFFVNERRRNQTKDQDDADGGNAGAELVKRYLTLWMDLFKMTLNVYDLQPFRHSILARLFMLLFIYLISILFNM